MSVFDDNNYVCVTVDNQMLHYKQSSFYQFPACSDQDTPDWYLNRKTEPEILPIQNICVQDLNLLYPTEVNGSFKNVWCSIC